MAPSFSQPARLSVLRKVAASSRRLIIWRPLAMLIMGVTAGAATLWMDRTFEFAWDVIDVTTARTMLATLAGSMITATVVMFWIRGMIVGTHSGHLPSRILTSYLGDTYQQWVMGLMVGVFGFLISVLFGLPSTTDGSVGVTPISVLLAVVLTVVVLLTIIQSIDTGARSMHEQRIMMRIVEEGLGAIERLYPEHSERVVSPIDPGSDSNADVVVWGVGFGWIWYIDEQAILDALPPGAVCHRCTRVGEFVSPATQLCWITLPPRADSGDVDPEAVATSFGLMDMRSPHHDIAMAIRSIVDVSLSGLGTGSADRTTAREAIPHLGVIVRALLLRDGPPQVWADDKGRWMVQEGEGDFTHYINLAFHDLRHAYPDPITVQTILSTLGDLIRAANATERTDRADLLSKHARLLVEQIEDHTGDTDEFRWIAGAYIEGSSRSDG